MMTLAIFLLQSPPPPQGGLGSLFINMLPLVGIFAVFYFLMIVPQRKRQRALQETIARLKAGDRIITSGGIIATVTAVRDTSLLVRTADKSILEISRNAGARLQDRKSTRLNSSHANIS